MGKYLEYLKVKYNKGQEIGTDLRHEHEERLRKKLHGKRKD